ncbi:MAG: right-handed parallel beta-helix repeat-containing protein [Candidatus Bathyarchaeota archaeon]|nr:right-handed parallel beta-helix repeat-containing protein [Candidatus Bathyarchaeota archaeon]
MNATSFRVFLVSLLVGMLGSLLYVQPVRGDETIYIHADGTISPPEVPISSVDYVTYTLTGTIYDSIVVNRSNIIVDGAGYTVQGFGIGEGFRLYGVNNVTIKNTNIKGFTYSIYLDLANDSVISRNNMSANSFDGIELHDSSNNVISGNNIKTNEWYGIGLYYSSNNLIERNNITNSYSGIRFYYSRNNTVYQNHLADSFYGMGISNSSNNSIFHNNFVNNTYHVYCRSSIDAWDNGYPSGGNYWSDHNPPDEDFDKIGDLPYAVDENNTDRYPLIYPYGFMPKPDVNGDGIVNIVDIATVAKAYGCKPGDSNWNPIADLDVNGVIDILDIAKVAKYYGRTV